MNKSSSELTSKPVLDSNINTLGEGLGTLHYYTVNEWCNAHLIWRQFVNLFGSGPERVDLMNSSGSGFFYTVDKVFFESVLLSICRISDPEKTAGKTNLTVFGYNKYVTDEKQREELQNLLSQVTSTTKFARDWRNRHISHNDYGLLTGAAAPLERATIENVDLALTSIFDILRFINITFLDTDMWDQVLADYNNEFVMLRRLFHGRRHHEWQLRNLEDNVFIDDDEPDWLLRPAR